MDALMRFVEYFLDYPLLLALVLIGGGFLATADLGAEPEAPSRDDPAALPPERPRDRAR
jgi:hypothetical protein